MMPLEKSHSSPGSSKSSSDGQLRSHGPSRSQSKSSVTQAHLEDAGIAIAAAEAAVQQSRLQPSKSFPYPWHASCDILLLPMHAQLCWGSLIATWSLKHSPIYFIFFLLSARVILLFYIYTDICWITETNYLNIINRIHINGKHSSITTDFFSFYHIFFLFSILVEPNFLDV